MTDFIMVNNKCHLKIGKWHYNLPTLATSGNSSFTVSLMFQKFCNGLLEWFKYYTSNWLLRNRFLPLNMFCWKELKRVKILF